MQHTNVLLHRAAIMQMRAATVILRWCSDGSTKVAMPLHYDDSIFKVTARKTVHYQFMSLFFILPRETTIPSY
jgi:hypothetical protein